MLDAYRRRPERYEHDLASDQAIEAYYRKLYGDMRENYQDYALDKPRTTLFDLLSYNTAFYDEDAAGMFLMNQAFKLAGSRFEVFDSSTRDVVVPYGEGVDLIAELAGRDRPDPAFLADWVRRARPCTVAVYDWQLKALGNAVTEYSGAAVLDPAFYDKDTGLILRPKGNDFLEV